MTPEKDSDATMPAAGDDLAAGIAAHLAELTRHPDRHVGGEGNRAATAYFARVAGELGCEVGRIGFDCVEWLPGPASIEARGQAFEIASGPYSPALDTDAPLLPVATYEELSATDATGTVLFVHGPLASEQLTPRNYPFYSFEQHTRILDAIEAASPLALVAATGRNPGSTAALYPFPLVEDPDFHLPSAVMTDVEGARLLASDAGTVRLRIDSGRRETRAEQIVARVPSAAERSAVVCAHIDSRMGTPGALNNAGGVATLLALAEVLRAAPVPGVAIELVPFNGEDDAAAPGEVAYIAARGGTFDGVALAVNVDDAGYREGASAVSLYACPDDARVVVDAAIAASPGIIEGPAWPQSDHMVFAMRGVPSVAITAERMVEVSSTITHTAADVPSLVDAGKLAQVARFIADVLGRL